MFVGGFVCVCVCVCVCVRGCVRWYLEADGLLDVLHFELLEEALVLAPEQPDVRDAVQDHGQPLQPQTEGPAQLVPRPRCKDTTGSRR